METTQIAPLPDKPTVGLRAAGQRNALAPLYEAISRTAIHAVKPEHVATFLGRRLTGNFNAELGNDFNTRIQGTRIRHHIGPTSIKMYDTFGRVLRIETTRCRWRTRSA